VSELSLFEDVLPEYVRPSMGEIRARPKNGLVAVGSFSGCGGSSLGLKMAGWDVKAAIEFIPAAAETYRANFPETTVFERDIRKVTAEEILEAIGMERGELDLFEGSPPCASFSSAGAGAKDWGKEKKYSDSKQRTDDLFYEWVRLLEGFYPRAFIAENVPGLVSGRALSEYAHLITGELGKRGYRVSATVLNAANYGVPQERKRLIFVGIRTDEDVTWTFPGPTTPSAHTTRQALDSVDPEDPDHEPYVEASSMEPYAVGRTWHALVERGAQRAAHGDRDGIPALEDFCQREECGKPLSDHLIYVKREDDSVVWVPVVEAEEARRNGAKKVGVTNGGAVTKARCADGEAAAITKDYFMFQIPSLDRPCQTLTATGSSAGAASVTHPVECRKFTPAEAKAVCGFPPDFVLTGSREQRYERMGRAVPPPLYEVLGRALAERLS
jgi:DNA (cytosine-5)-methyltransferase 1